VKKRGNISIRTLSEGILDAVCTTEMIEASAPNYPVERLASDILLSAAKARIDSGVWEQVKLAAGHEIELFMRRLTGETE